MPVSSRPLFQTATGRGACFYDRDVFTVDERGATPKAPADAATRAAENVLKDALVEGISLGRSDEGPAAASP